MHTTVPNPRAEAFPPPRYELREHLGTGGMGEVFRAWDTLLEREVALKLVRTDLPAGSRARERILREARMAATLSHPNICVVHDVGELEGRPFVTMELLRGETLRGVLAREGALAPRRASLVARGVAAALA
ncbi:MAG: protein kinase domain-containing protein, partial [Gemmatimonadales bacterium]